MIIANWKRHYDCLEEIMNIKVESLLNLCLLNIKMGFGVMGLEITSRFANFPQRSRALSLLNQLFHESRICSLGRI